MAKSLLEKAKNKNVQLHLPVDSIAANAFANDAKYYITPDANIHPDYMGLDIGPETIARYKKLLLNLNRLFGMDQWECLKWKIFQAEQNPSLRL